MLCHPRIRARGRTRETSAEGRHDSVHRTWRAPATEVFGVNLGDVNGGRLVAVGTRPSRPDESTGFVEERGPRRLLLKPPKDWFRVKWLSPQGAPGPPRKSEALSREDGPQTSPPKDRRRVAPKRGPAKGRPPATYWDQPAGQMGRRGTRPWGSRPPSRRCRRLSCGRVRIFTFWERNGDYKYGLSNFLWMFKIRSTARVNFSFLSTSIRKH